MPELEVRPSMRLIKLGYAAVALLLALSVIWWANTRISLALAAVCLAAVLFLFPVFRHIERQRNRLRLEANSLRWERGLFSTSVKTIPLANIQDVTVHRTVNQRLWGVGTIHVEAAGHTSGVEIKNVERPQEVADRILAAVKPDSSRYSRS